MIEIVHSTQVVQIFDMTLGRMNTTNQESPVNQKTQLMMQKLASHKPMLKQMNVDIRKKSHKIARSQSSNNMKQNPSPKSAAQKSQLQLMSAQKLGLIGEEAMKEVSARRESSNNFSEGNHSINDREEESSSEEEDYDDEEVSKSSDEDSEDA